MQYLVRYRWLIVGAGLALAIVAFLAFRPDKIFVDDAVDESLADAFTTTSPVSSENATTTTSPLPTTTTVTGETSVPEITTTTSTLPVEPSEVVTGDFDGIDHAAEGTATIYEQRGNYVLRFEDDTDIQNGPDLYVWLLADDDYQGGSPSGYIDLGKIRGNVGGQNYDLPPEYDPEVHRYVLIWCLRFTTPFAGAPLA